jgi:hypothetical protein
MSSLHGWVIPRHIILNCSIAGNDVITRLVVIVILCILHDDPGFSLNTSWSHVIESHTNHGYAICSDICVLFCVCRGFEIFHPRNPTSSFS